MPLTALAGTLGRKRATHLLRRATFGATKAQIDQVAAMTVSEAMDILFVADDLGEPAFPIDPATGQEWITPELTDANSDERDLLQYFNSWHFGQLLALGVPEAQALSYATREKITFLLHTIFTTIASKVNNSKSIYYQNALFRKFSFDDNGDPAFNFKTLSKKVCVENAMLRFLDGDTNVLGSPNENFGREFLELFSIGRGLEGTLAPLPAPGDYFNYTEQDVQAAALVFSGFTIDKTFANIDPDTDLPRGVVRGGTIASSHDNTTKQFSYRFNNATVTPDPTLLVGGKATEESALDEIDQLIEMIYGVSDEAARNICRKIYRFYVYYDIDQALDDDIIDNLTQTFKDSGYKLQPVLMDLFQSEHFYEAGAGTADDNFGGIIKSPLDLTLGTIQALEIEVPDYTTDLDNYYAFMGGVQQSMNSHGMVYYEPPEVAGYPAYHQFPIYNRSWISTNYLAERYQFIQQLIDNKEPDEPGNVGVDVLSFVQNNFSGVAADAKDLIIELCQYFLPMNDGLTFNPAADDLSEITAERLNYFLMAFLYSPQIDTDPEGSWSFRWNNAVDNEVVERQLKNLFNALMQSPEFQLS
ncbi:DUF1800 domain-containing protein [Reichenbachiella carrageenanivorans]|uniref:DUF1800 domain-containing protein n=1 Tax=Reichenbachiella carrageenanivorans TaxID=2979869 RepID=A0ABY6CW52_9BACT|nr:DUF1800 domain-containing protein [Reichenbachiella carrageenanivorans]UXX78130.1 DUF1800 domain-containing protein [Reichenbachiella carrageenanivorans]